MSITALFIFDDKKERIKLFGYILPYGLLGSFGYEQVKNELISSKTSSTDNLPEPAMSKNVNNQSSLKRYRLILTIFFLALLYAINNNLAFSLFTMADPATIALFKSVTSFMTALLMYFALKRPIIRIQWFAILFQCLGLVVFQYDPCQGSTIYPMATYLLLAVAVGITTTTSVTNDHLLKTADLNLNSVNALLYFFGTILNFMFFIRERSNGGPDFFEGYTTQACIVVFFNSIIGIVITAVYKYGDALVKSFASSITAVLLLVISSIFFGLKANIVTWTGGIITVLATYMYMTGKSASNAGNSRSK